MPGGLGVIGSESSVLEYQDAAGAWHFVPGVSSWTESGGDAPTRDVVAFEGVGSKTGRQRPQTVECEVAAYMPNHPAWKYMRNAAVAKTVIRVRLTTLAEELYKQTAGKTLAVPALGVGAYGVATVAGNGDFDPTSSNFAPGMEVVIGTKRYTIAYIKGINTEAAEDKLVADATPWYLYNGTGVAIDAETADPAFSIVIPALRRGPFAAEIVTTDNSTLAAEGDLSSGLTLRPKSLLPEWTVV